MDGERQGRERRKIPLEVVTCQLTGDNLQGYLPSLPPLSLSIHSSVPSLLPSLPPIHLPTWFDWPKALLTKGLAAFGRRPRRPACLCVRAHACAHFS